MNWKTFFKPTRGKGITVIILIALGFMGYMGNFGCYFSEHESVPCSIISSTPSAFLLKIIIWPGISVLTSTNDFINSTRPLGQQSPYSSLKPLFWVLAIVVDFLWLYVIVSLITYLFHSLRKNKRGEQKIEATNASSKTRKAFPTVLDICLIVVFIIGVIVMNIKINLPGPSSMIWAPLVIIFFYFFFKVFK